MMTALMRGSIGDILATSSGRMLMEQAMRECSGGALRSGFSLPDAATQIMRSRLLDLDSNWVASMARDMAIDAPRIEADAIIGDMIKRAAAHDVEAPLLTTAYCHLQVYQNQQNRKLG
ncbi:MAG: ketopantoate reductase C-terminal domain-containing protein, partial [Janthinobacterium lividum]